MANGRPATRTEMILIGLLFAGVGLFFVSMGAELFPVPGGQAGLHAPLWVVACAGLIFFLGGASVLVQALGNANGKGELPAGAPVWMRAVQRLFVVAILASFAIIASWIAFYGEADQFSGSFTGHGFGVTIARAAFGFGALVCWLATLGVAVSSLRTLTEPGRRT